MVTGTCGTRATRPAYWRGVAPHVAAGFSLIELMVVLASLGLLLAIAAPRYTEHVDRAREAVLRQNLSAIRESIDRFHADRGRYPADLDELVRERYLRRKPLDPITDRDDTWVPLPVPGQSATALYDIRSGAPGASHDGSRYAQW